MTESYFTNRLQSLDCPKDILKSIKTQLYSSTEKIAKVLKSKSVLPKLRPDFSEIIQKIIKKLDSADIELNIRLSKLKEAKKHKKHLEAKLQFLKSSIEGLNHLEDLIEKPKIDLRDSQARHEFLEKEKLKSKNLQKKLQKYHKDHKKQEEKIQKRILELEQELQAEKLKEIHLASQKQEEKRKMYQEYLQKVHEKAQNRKKELKLQESIISSSAKVPKSKPLFVQLSEKFINQVEMPELEKRKKELSEKRLANSYSSKHVLDHAKWYADFKKESNLKRRKELDNRSADRKFHFSEQSLSSWQARIIEEEKILKEEKIKGRKDFFNRLDKKAQYSSLVKQLYSPNFSQNRKQAESVKEVKTERVFRDSKEKEEWKPHKFKPNKMVPPQLPRKDFEVIDYLQEFRVKKKEEEEEKERKDAENLMKELKAQISKLSGDPSLPKAEDSAKVEKSEKKEKQPKQETQKLDKEILKKEWKITSSSKVNLKLTQEVNEMYLSSIRAKLSFLENIQNN